LTSTVDDALDLVQETFLKAARAPDSIPRGVTDEEAWLVRVLVNVRRDQWRRERVRKRHDRTLKPAITQDDHPESAFVIHTIVWKALDHLPPRRRTVVMMHELEELETAAIASLLDISAITVRWHLVQGRRQLARHLKNLGVFDESPQQLFAGRRPSSSRPTTS
jgi:RNA polymerase sigma-70 factor, ECF subfamily